MSRSTTLGSTSQSRREVVEGISSKVRRALAENPEEVTGVLAIVIRREGGHGHAKALQCGAVWGRGGWEALAQLAGEMLAAMGQQVADGERERDARRGKAGEN